MFVIGLSDKKKKVARKLWTLPILKETHLIWHRLICQIINVKNIHVKYTILVFSLCDLRSIFLRGFPWQFNNLNRVFKKAGYIQNILI